MNQRNFLSNIIRKVERAEAAEMANTKTNNSTKKVVVIDKRTQKVHYKIPVISFGSDLEYYIVNNDSSVLSERRTLPIEVADFSNNRTLDISVNYRASYSADKNNNEGKVAKAFQSDNSPETELEQKIRKWVIEFTRDCIADFIDNYSEKVRTLTQYLQNTAREEIGIQLDLNISLAELEPIKIRPSEITVHVSDSDEALDLTIETELSVADQIKAISHSNKWGTIELTKLLKDEIKLYLQEHTKITEFYYELKDKVRNALVDYLNQKLADKGWRILFLNLSSKVVISSPAPKELIEIKHIVECRVQNHSRLIPVENTLQMLAQDVRRYISAQQPNLQAWSESKLEKIVKPLLLSKNYLDILSDFRTVSDEIRYEMGKAAESIGYKIQHIVSIPRLPHFDLKSDFEIENKNEEFSTNTASIKVKLTTTVNARFDNFNQIEHYLDRGVDEIIEEMRKVVNTKTREVLRQIDPESFYMYFYADATEAKSVEKKLQDEITEALKKRFGVNVITVVPIPEETYIIEYLQRLMGMIGKFECEIPSNSGAEPVKLEGQFKVETIGERSWYKFQSVFLSKQQSQQRSRRELEQLNKQHSDLMRLGDEQENRFEIDQINQRINAIENDIFGLDEIRHCIQESLISNLFGIFDSPDLQYTSRQVKSEIDEAVNKWAYESVIDQYGLKISLKNIKRSQTDREKYQQQLTQKTLEVNYEQSIKQIEESKNQSQQKLEARTTKIEKQLNMSKNIYEDKDAQLQELYKQRRQLKLIGDEDSKQELKYIEEEIRNLESEIIDLSREESIDEPINLNLLKPQPSKPSSFLEAKQQNQKNLPPSQNNQDSQPNGDKDIKNYDDENIR